MKFGNQIKIVAKHFQLQQEVYTDSFKLHNSSPAQSMEFLKCKFTSVMGKIVTLALLGKTIRLLLQRKLVTGSANICWMSSNSV